MSRNLISALIVLIAGLCFGQNSWREKMLSRAVHLQGGVGRIHVNVNLRKSVITFPPQLSSVSFDTKVLSLTDSASLYRAAVSWEERDFENPDPDSSVKHTLDSSSACPIRINEKGLLDLLIEFKVLRMGRCAPCFYYTPPDSYDEVFFSFVYDSVAITSFLERCETLPYVLYVNVPIWSKNSTPSGVKPRPGGGVDKEKPPAGDKIGTEDGIYGRNAQFEGLEEGSLPAGAASARHLFQPPPSYRKIRK